MVGAAESDLFEAQFCPIMLIGGIFDLIWLILVLLAGFKAS